MSKSDKTPDSPVSQIKTDSDPCNMSDWENGIPDSPVSQIKTDSVPCNMSDRENGIPDSTVSHNGADTAEQLFTDAEDTVTTETVADELSDLAYLTREKARRELARKSYKRYLYYVHGESWKRTKMSDFLADTLQRFVEEDTGNAYDILLIEAPPQHGKSLTVTESFPSWYLGRYPKNRVIEASYNDDTAKKFGRKNMQKVEQFGGALFGLQPGSIWTTNEFELSNGWGRMLSAGIKAGITGNPANLLIIDDPIKNREEADSKNNRDKIWNEWQNTLKSRLQAKAKVIIIMTPWHEDDLAARVLQNEQNVTLVRLPVEAEEHDLLGRAVGDALCPELGKDNAWLQQFKQSYLNDPSNGGLRAWSALFQCSPRTEGGNIVQRSWWQTYNRKDITSFGTTVISVDAAFKDAESNDYVAIQVWSKLGNNYYGRYGLKKHLDFPSTVSTIRLMKKLFPETRYILIEDKANGSAIIQVLRSEFIGVIGITPKGGKVSRVNSCAPAIESGNVFLPENELWAEELIDTFSQFPAVEHDDDVDAATQALNWMLFTNGRPSIASAPTAQQAYLEAAERREQEAFLSPKMYDVYSSDSDFY